MIILETNVELGLNSVFFGDRSILVDQFKKILNQNFETENVEISEISKLNISIADVRNIISHVNKTSDEKKIIILSSFYWSDEVQNALLKVLEESPKNTNFFLFGYNEKFFLGTVLSRLQKYDFRKNNKFLKLAQEVMSLEPNIRLQNSKVKKILSQKVVDINYQNNQENEKKDRETHIIFCDALINVILENKEKIQLKKEYLEKIVKITTIYDIEGGSPHLFIEWILLSTPVIDVV